MRNYWTNTSRGFRQKKKQYFSLILSSALNFSCGGAGGVQNLCSIPIRSLTIFRCHLATCFLDNTMGSFGQAPNRCVQFTIFDFQLTLWFGRGCHTMRAFLVKILFGHKVYPICQDSGAKVTLVTLPLDYAKAVLDGRRRAYLALFSQRDFAAFKALSLRSSAVMVIRLRFPPIRPPFTPIFDMIRETSAGTLGLGLLISPGSSIDRCTI